MVHDKVVVARSADQCVGTGAADQGIIAATSDKRIVPDISPKDVVSRIAGEGSSGRNLQHSNLDVGCERVTTHESEHDVVALARIFDDVVAHIVHDKDIVAGSADHRVGAGTTFEVVVAATADKRVVSSIAP